MPRPHVPLVVYERFAPERKVKRITSTTFDFASCVERYYMEKRQICFDHPKTGSSPDHECIGETIIVHIYHPIEYDVVYE